MYYGRAGGVEAYYSAQPHGKTLCIDIGAQRHNTWGSGHNTRLMRHPDIGGNTENDMDQITSFCAMCCKK